MPEAGTACGCTPEQVAEVARAEIPSDTRGSLALLALTDDDPTTALRIVKELGIDELNDLRSHARMLLEMIGNETTRKLRARRGC
jgi:hypothetical protein